MPDLYSYNWSDKSKSRVTLQDLKVRIATSINAVKEKIKNVDILDFTALKFAETAIWPYPVKKKNECNFVEFINQLFTTVASVKAVEFLVENGCLEENNKWKMCLGTTPGRDLIVYDGESPQIIAEIFAVTAPGSNSKLKDEIQSLAKDKTKKVDRYAFFILAEDEFNKLNEKGGKQHAISWTKYGPKTADKLPITVDDKITIHMYPNKENPRATWECKCGDKTIKIVCWSSKGCLEGFVKKLT